MASLNEVQENIVKTTEGAIMVLAGAGSGKTRVLTHRIAYILQNHLAYPDEILAITFTNKASKEMRDRLSNMGLDATRIWAQTFHSFCCRILRYEAHNIEGHDRNFSIYDENDKKMVLKKVLKELSLKEDDYLNLVAHAISDRKNQNMSIDEYKKYNLYQKDIDIVCKIMAMYQDVLIRSNAFDFDDLLLETLNLFKNNNDVLLNYSKRFKYISIDEFQDTNGVQYELCRMLASYHGNIFAVGDEDQSIYSWRGANIKNIQNFLKDFQNAKLFKLEQNYRSTKNILSLANKIIKNNTNRIDKTLWTDNEQGVKVEYLKNYNETEEAENVVKTIYSLTHSSNYKYKDIAILMRLNALTRSFEDKLLSYNIPYKVFGGLKFYDRQEIKNLLAYLKLLINSHDDESFYRIINFPKRGIGDSAINDLKMYAGGYNLLSAVLQLDDNCDKKLKKFLPFKQLMLDLKQKEQEKNLTEFVQYVIDRLNLAEVYNTDKEEDKNRILNLNEFVTAVNQFESSNAGATLVDYLQSVSLISDLDTYDDEDNTVTLATVHSAKGLEFKVVFIVGLEEKYFPIIRDDTSIESMEEERRLMYVAITRAEERLYLTNATSRFMYGRTNYSTPSRFLKELDILKPQKSQNAVPQKPTINYASGMSYNTKTNYSTSNVSKLVKNENQNFGVGDNVKHIKFGVGKVVQVDASADMIIIEFDGFGRKVLSMKFAPISKV